MDKVRAIFMIVIAGSVLLMFGLGVIFAASYTLCGKPCAMPGIVSNFVSMANGPLAANLGVLLGISIARRGWRGPENETERFQWLAAGWYVAMLLAAVAGWGTKCFADDASQVVPLLPELTKNAIGIFIAILATVLGVNTAFARARTGGGEAT